MRIQAMNGFEEEVALDSDDERNWRAVGNGLDLKKRNLFPICEQENDFAGHSKKVFGSVRANVTYKEHDNTPPFRIGTLFQKRIALESDELSRLEYQCSASKNVEESTKDRDSGEYRRGIEDKANRNKVCSNNRESFDGGYSLGLNYATSQEPGESSQATALEFVDRMVSSNDVGYSQGLETEKILKGDCCPISSAKGAQSLARMIHLRTLTREKGFEWADSHQDGAVDIAEISTAKNFIKELDERLETGSSVQQFENNSIGRDTNDIFDGVFNTQMAAEVMETLSYGVLANGRADDAFQGQLATLEDSLGDVAKYKACSEQISLERRSCSAAGTVSRNLKLVKMPASRLSEQTSSSFQDNPNWHRDLDPELKRNKEKRTKFLDEHDGICMNSVNATKSLGRKSDKPIKRRKAQKSADRSSNKDFEQNLNSGISLDHTLFGQSEGVHGFVSPIAHRTRNASTLNSLKRIKEPSHKSREGTNDVIEIGPKYKRKPICVLRTKIKNPKLGPDISGEVGSSNQSQEEQTGLSTTAPTSCLNLDAWSYPKGKRTHRNAPVRLNGASHLYEPFIAVDGIEDIIHSNNSPKRSKANLETNNFNLNMKRKTWSSVYCGPFWKPNEKISKGSISGQNFDKPGSAQSSNANSAFLNKQEVPVRVDASGQSGKLDVVESMSSADDAEMNLKVEVLPNEEKKQYGSENTTSFDCTKGSSIASPGYMDYGYHKQPCKKNLPRSSLIKELIQLGVSDLLPNFSSKFLRRHKDMANIRVLFSQHLEDGIIKHQKKILRQLGISIALCSSDATHFVTDKFVRTRNMLETIASGKPVVTHLWLESCGQASCYIDEKTYILRDAKKEKEIGFSMLVSLARARQHPLLKGHKVLVTKNIGPDKEMIASLVNAVKGQVVEIEKKFMEDEKIPQDLLILSCEEDYAICMPFLDKGAAVYSSELLLNGIVIQKLECQRHQLFTNQVKRNCSSLRSRKDGNFFL